MEAKADLVIDSAKPDFPQGGANHVKGMFFARQLVMPQ
jgi:hypothetical protein